MKIGYLLTSADPIHIAHLSLATKSLNEKAVDKVRIVPCVANPWKKKHIASFEERCQMIRNACRFIDNCELDDIEKTLNPPYYSCYTLEALRKKYGETNAHYIIGGADLINALPKFKNYKEMIEGRFGVIAFTRAGKKPSPDTEIPYVLIESDIPDLSSTYIRDLISRGLNPYPCVPECNLEICRKIYSNKSTI